MQGVKNLPAGEQQAAVVVAVPPSMDVLSRSSQNLSTFHAGVKNLLAGEQQAAVTVAVEALMDAKPEADAFATFDPKARFTLLPYLLKYQLAGNAFCEWHQDRLVVVDSWGFFMHALTRLHLVNPLANSMDPDTQLGPCVCRRRRGGRRGRRARRAKPSCS